MARPQRAHRSTRESPTFVQPERFPSHGRKRWPDWASTWLPLIALLTLLVLVPFWLVRLMGWLIAQ